MLAWGNINLFDFRNQLVHDRISVAMLPPPKGYEELLNPLGTTGNEVVVMFSGTDIAHCHLIMLRFWAY